MALPLLTVRVTIQTAMSFYLPVCVQANAPVLQSTHSTHPTSVHLCLPLSTSVRLCPQVHVLSYSLHALLCGLSQDLASGDLDPCLQSISDIVAEDLFGQLAEEREVPEAVSKLPEAKSSKGLATLEIVSSKLSPQLLPSLIAPLKKVGAVCASVFAIGSTTHCCWVLSLIQDTVLFHHPLLHVSCVHC